MLYQHLKADKSKLSKLITNVISNKDNKVIKFNVNVSQNYYNSNVNYIISNNSNERTVKKERIEEKIDIPLKISKYNFLPIRELIRHTRKYKARDENYNEAEEY